MLDTVLKSGLISLKTYIKAYPDNALTDKKKILKEIEGEELSEASRLKAELDALKTQLGTNKV